MRPVLRPGLQIIRRDLRSLQLGLDWPGLAVISDSTSLEAVLRAIDGFRDLDGVLLAACAEPGTDPDECQGALTALVEAGAVVDRSSAVGTDEGRGAAWWLLAGPQGDGTAIGSARRSCRVWITSSDRPGLIASKARDLLDPAGLAAAPSMDSADVIIAAFDDVPDRAVADSLMHSGVPHVWAHLRDLVGVIGPFVVPGRSACLRCTDASRTQIDPTWPAVLSALAARPRVVSPCDPVLATAVAAWVVQEVAMWASLLVPSTYGAIIEVPLGLGPTTSHDQAPHPQCGCGWRIRQDTIGA